MSNSSMKAFRALVWKELREAAIPGAAAFVIVAVCLVYSMSREQQFTAIDLSGMFPTSLFTIVSAGVALLIGGAQLIRERRGDMAAFLFHRPVERATLFWSKALAGIAWYVIAAGIPLAASYIWRALPGRSAFPFVASMMLPGIADLSSGLVYYFAALLTVMRAARWYASAVLPLAAAFTCSLLETSAESFGGAIARTAVCLVVLIVAARSVFVARGSYEPQTRLGRAALALCVCAGLAVISVVPLFELFGAIERTPTPAPRAAVAPSYTETELAADGQLVRATWQSRYDVDGRTLVGIRALDEHPLDALADSVRGWKRVDVGVIATADIPLELDGDYPEVHLTGYRGTQDVFVPLLRDPMYGTTAWYFMRRLGLIDVYANYGADAGHLG